jgi:F-type H+-transporting ATPase subunit alpha
MTRLKTTGLSQEAQARLRRGEVITQLIIQEKNKPVSMEEQVIFLYALTSNMLDRLSTKELNRFKKEFPKLLQDKHPEVFSEMRQSRKLSDENKKKIKDTLELFLQGNKEESPQSA